MRTPASAAVGACAALLLAGCSLIDSPSSAKDTAATAAASSGASSSAPSSYSPLTGPVEAAAALPQTCTGILTLTQLQASFGPGVPIGTQYGSFAPLASIGRTGRVACIFGVGMDSFGRESTGVLEVQIATYTSASEAVGRAADTVQSDSEAGSTTAAVSVGGHPATLVVEPNAVSASSPAAPAASGASGPASTAASSVATPPPAGPPSASATASSASNGESELVMADGNRTFVLQIPFSKLTPAQANAVLPQLALAVYQNTMPAVPSSPSAPRSPSPSKA